MPLADLVTELDARARTATKTRQSDERSWVAYPRGMLADDAPIKPSDIACAVNDLFDRHRPMPMMSHIGDCLFTAMEIENTALAAPAVTREWASGCPLALDWRRC